MSNTVSGRDHLVDLESGGTTSAEDGPRCAGSGLSTTQKVLGKVCRGFATYDERLPGKDGVLSTTTCDVPGTTRQSSFQALNSAGLEQEAYLADIKNIVTVEKPKMKGHKKAPKPPRPPKPPSLDAADQKLIKEISELATLRKARIERMKALRNARAAKSASSSNNICPLVVTIIFCLIIVLQGLFSRASFIINSNDSPESAVQMHGVDLISISYSRNVCGSEGYDLGSQSPNVVELMMGSEVNDQKVVI